MSTACTTAKQEDFALIAKAAEGDTRAFDVLMRLHNQQIYRAVRSILHDEAEAEDAVQDAWWKAYTHLQDFRGNAQPATWLTRIAINEALMRLRRNKSRNSVIQSMPENLPEQDNMPNYEPQFASSEASRPEHLTWRAELRRLIERRIDALPDMYRTVFMLRAVDGVPASEVAIALGLPEATVRVRYMRARRLMQTALRQDIDSNTTEAFSFAGDRCDRIVAGVHARMRAAGVR